MIEEDRVFKVGDKIYQISNKKILAIYTIVKVTKTLAISSKGSKFKIKWNSIIRVPSNIWDASYYRFETPELKEQFKCQQIRNGLLNKIKNVSWEEVENNVIVDVLKMIQGYK